MSLRPATLNGPRPPASGPAGATAIVAALAAAGTRVVFGVPGGGPNLDVVGAADAAGLRFVLTHGETAAAIMAATSADQTGAPGAVLVTRGPGLASAVNGIAHAALDRLPLVAIADTVRADEAGRVSHQRLDQAALGASVAKAVLTIGGDRAGQAAARAVRRALAAPPGPVIALMDDEAPAADPAPDLDEESPDKAGSARAGDLGPLATALRQARRPVLLLGERAVAHTAAIRAAVAGRGIPALHTYRARGIVPDSAAEAGGLVTGGTMEWPLLARADLIIGLGVDEAEMIPAAWDYAAPTVLVSEWPAERTGLERPGLERTGIERTGSERTGAAGYFTGATTLTAPLPAAIELLAAWAPAAGPRWAPGAGRAARAEAARRLCEAASAAPGTLAPQQVAAVTRAHTPPETIATVDAGAHMLAVMPLWEVDQPRRLLISSGLATMGFALPAAIAAALCAPAAPASLKRASRWWPSPGTAAWA